LNLAEEVAGEIGIWVCFLQQTKLLFGLLREAEQEFRLLQKATTNSDLARNLLRQVQSLRRRQ